MTFKTFKKIADLFIMAFGGSCITMGMVLAPSGMYQDWNTIEVYQAMTSSCLILGGLFFIAWVVFVGIK